MSETKFFKCSCAHCAGHIEFPADAAGLSLPCPHCGRDTDLIVALAPAPLLADETTKVGKKLMWMAAAGVVLVIGLFVGLAALNKFKDRLESKRVAKAAPQRTPAPAPPTAPRPPPPVSINEFTVADLAIEQAPKSTLIYATGLVRNNADRQRFGVRIELDLLDAASQKIGTAKDYLPILDPKKEWRIKALVVDARAVRAQLAVIRED